MALLIFIVVTLLSARFESTIKLNESCLAIWKALDILGCALWLAPLYIVGLADRPTGRQLISSYIGMAAYNGHRWALVAQALLDKAAQLLGDRPRHCERAFLKYRDHDN